MSLDPTHQSKTDYTGFINESGELEIEYLYKEVDSNFAEDIALDLSVTISYNVTSIDKEGASVEYRIVGSANYLPSDFDQLVIDYIHEMPFMKSVKIYKITKV